MLNDEFSPSNSSTYILMMQQFDNSNWSYNTWAYLVSSSSYIFLVFLKINSSLFNLYQTLASTSSLFANAS